MMKWIISLFLPFLVEGFYLPGIAPVSYCSEDFIGCKSDIPAFVNRLVSQESAIPYEYNAFDFCTPNSSLKSPVENLGQVLFGERIRPSPYQFKFQQKENCRLLCKKSYDKDSDELKFLKQGMYYSYENRWIIDNMPVLWCYNISKSDKFCHAGFPIGCYIDGNGKPKGACSMSKNRFGGEDVYYIFNHVDITIHYHLLENTNESRLVYVTLKPHRSVRDFLQHEQFSQVKFAALQTSYSFADDNCMGPPLQISNKFTKEIKINYTYSVEFKECSNARQASNRWTLLHTKHLIILQMPTALTLERRLALSFLLFLFIGTEKRSHIKWSSRWDYILDSVQHSHIHWFPIFNSITVILFLSAFVAIVLIQSLRLDIVSYNEHTRLNVCVEEHGWKLVHADVFRPPRSTMLLCVFVGVGFQIVAMTFITLFCSLFGFLSPANRGALATAAIILFVCFSFIAGFISAYLYKGLEGKKWRTNTLMTSFLISGFIFFIFFAMNLMLWAEGSSAAIPVGTLFAILSLWFGVSAPLTLVGALFGYKMKKMSFPVQTNHIPRLIPPGNFFNRPLLTIFFGGVLPFGSIFIQFFFILNSMWSHQFYYMFGILFLVTLILVIVCCEISILLCYFQLSVEDHRWWWRSFLSSGCTAFYFFLYAIYFGGTKYTIDNFSSNLIYYSYTLIMALFLFLFTGSVGFAASLCFVRKIYNEVKVD